MQNSIDKCARAMGKLPEPASDFLRPEDVEDGDIVKIVAHPEVIPAEQTKYGRERHVIPVALPSGEQKRWGLNLTSYRTLYKAFGGDGDDWIGQSLTVTKNREKVRGETRFVLYAEPYKQPQQALPTKPAEAPTEATPEYEKWLTPAFYKLPEHEQQKILRKLSMQQ